MCARSRRPRPKRHGERCLITGVAGFLGSHLADRLLAEQYEVSGIDSLRSFYDKTQKMANVAPAIENGLDFHNVDAIDARSGEIFESVDSVLHFAGRPRTDEEAADIPREVSDLIRDDLLATSCVVDGCLAAGVRRLVVASSIYDPSSAETQRGTRATRSTIMSWHGVRAAREAVALRRTLGTECRVVILRYDSVYGPRQRPDMAFSRIVQGALVGDWRKIGPLPAQLDATYVDDAIAATVAAVKRGPRTFYELASGNPVSLQDVLDVIRKLTGLDVHVEEVIPTKRIFSRPPGNTAAARRELGFNPRTSLSDGLSSQFAAALIDKRRWLQEPNGEAEGVVQTQ